MNGAELQAKTSRGEFVYGTMLFMAQNPRWVKILQRVGFDYIIVDTEHAAFSSSEVASLIVALEGHGIAPLVRIPYPAAHLVTKSLDMGAHGILAPYCETAEQVSEIVTAARWRPLKGSLRDQLAAGGDPPNEETSAFLNKFNQHRFTMIGIESVPAVQNLEAIVEVEGIDALFVGPHDLAISLGIPGQYDHPDYVAAVRRIIQAGASRSIPVTIHLHTAEDVNHWVDEGMKIVLFRTDTRAMAGGYLNDVKAIRQRIGDT